MTACAQVSFSQVDQKTKQFWSKQQDSIDIYIIYIYIYTNICTSSCLYIYTDTYICLCVNKHTNKYIFI